MIIQEEADRRYPPSLLIETPGGDDYYRDDEYGYDECQRNAFIAGAEWARKEALVQAEAVIQKVRDDAAEWLKAPRGEMAPCTGVGRYFTALVDASPSVVLADHDKEVAARALEAAADSHTMPATAWKVRPWMRNLAAAIRSGGTGDHR